LRPHCKIAAAVAVDVAKRRDVPAERIRNEPAPDDFVQELTGCSGVDEDLAGVVGRRVVRASADREV
jgi:hypothetical protein